MKQPTCFKQYVLG